MNKMKSGVRMKKNLFIISIIIMILGVGVFLFITNGKSPKTPEQSVIYLKNLESYSCSFDMEISNDKQKLNYSGRQFYMKDKQYKIELGKDRVFTYKDDKIYVNDLDGNKKYSTDKDFDSVFKLSIIQEFIRLLYTDEAVKYSFKDVENVNNLLIELNLATGNRDMNKAVLYVDYTTNIPTKLIIYDYKQVQKISINYRNFIPNYDIKGN